MLEYYISQIRKEEGVGDIFWEKTGSWEGEKKEEERKLNLVRRKIVKWNVNRQNVTEYKDREIEIKL